MSNTEIVQRFIDTWASRDLDSILGFFTEDARYHNIPMEPLNGIAEIRAALAGFVGMATEIEWITHHISESASGVVLTERNDRFLVNGVWVDLPVMGTFELTGGKISGWRDYFDIKMFEAAMAATAAG